MENNQRYKSWHKPNQSPTAKTKQGYYKAVNKDKYVGDAKKKLNLPELYESSMISLLTGQALTQFPHPIHFFSSTWMRKENLRYDDCSSINLRTLPLFST